MKQEFRVVFFLGALAALPACKRSRSEASAVASTSASAPPAAAALAATSTQPIAVPPRAPMPTGPRLAVLAGKGLGPIRIGATTATIERLMEAPCDEKTPTLCRYFSRAIDFQLKNGVTERILVHRFGRSARDLSGHEHPYGMFNGAIPPTLLSLGMIPSAFHEDLGPPQRVEKVTEPNPHDTVERDYYPGMVLEFDRYSNGNLILGGIIIEKPASGAK